MINICKKVEAYYGDCYWWVRVSFTDLAYYAGCLGAVGVRGDVSALKWDRAYADGACTDGACTDKAYGDRACIDKAYGTG